METEWLWVMWAFEHSKYYGLGAFKINIRTDQAPLKGLFDKELSEIETPRIVKLIKQTLQNNLEFEHMSGKSNEGRTLKIGKKTTDAPKETRPFHNTKTLSRLTTRLAKVISIENIPLELQIITKDGEKSKKYEEEIEAVRKGTELKNLPNTHPVKKFSEGEYNNFHIIKRNM